MTGDRLKVATRDVLDAILRHTDRPDDALVILGTAISGVSRETDDPVGCAQYMIEGLEGWIRMYQDERRAVRE